MVQQLSRNNLELHVNVGKKRSDTTSHLVCSLLDSIGDNGVKTVAGINNCRRFLQNAKRFD